MICRKFGRWEPLALAFLLGAASFFSAPALAATETPTPVALKDFANARILETALEGAIYKTALPRTVYEGLVQSQHRDLAVFNSNGEIVPFVVREMPPVYGAVRQPDRAVPFFELPAEKIANAGAPVGPLDIYVRTGAGGQIVEIKGSAAASGNASRERRYLLDFSAIRTGGNAASHELKLSVSEEAELAARFSVFQSDNLRDWAPLVERIPLIRLKNKGARLSSDSVMLPRPPGRYLLLRIEDATAAFVLQGVDYASVWHSSVVADEQAEFDGAISSDKRSVEYDALGAFPASKVNFALQEPGLYKVRFSSRSIEKSEWRPLGSMELSMIRRSPSSTRTNASMPVDIREARYWRIDFESAFSGTPPKLQIGWRSSEVYFLAQGKPPYILAFGSSRKGLNLQSPSLLRDKVLQATAETAEFGAALALDPHPSLASGETEAERFGGIEWQRYLVWGLLIFGGLLLSSMAWKLLKSSGKGNP